MTKYKIEHRYLYGWDDLNPDEDVHFDTELAAQAEIDDICTAPELDYDGCDFRVVPLPAHS